MFIEPTKKAKDLYEVNEDLYLESLLAPKDSETPIPWDADMEIKDREIIFTGNMAPGGPAHGSCVCRFPIEKFSNYYTLQIPDDTSDEILNQLWEAGWREV